MGASTRPETKRRGENLINRDHMTKKETKKGLFKRRGTGTIFRGGNPGDPHWKINFLQLVCRDGEPPESGKRCELLSAYWELLDKKGRGREETLCVGGGENWVVSQGEGSGNKTE